MWLSVKSYLKNFTAKDSRLILIVCCLFSIGLIKAIFFAQFGLKMLTDDSQNFTGAYRLISGEAIYKSYQAFFPPLADYFLAWLLKLNSFDIVQTRYIYCAITAFLFPLLYLVSKRVASTGAALLVAVGFIFSDARIDLLFFNTFSIGGFYLVLRYLEQSSSRYLFVSGLLIGLESLFRIDFALATFFSCVLVLLIHQITTSKKSDIWGELISLSVVPTLISAFQIIWLINNNSLFLMIDNLKAGINAKYIYQIPFSMDKFFPIDLSLPVLYASLVNWLYTAWALILVLNIYVILKKLISNQIDRKEIILSGILAYILFITVFYLRAQFDLAHFIKGSILFFPLLAATMTNYFPRLVRGLAFFSFLGFLAMQLAYSFWFINFHNLRVNLSDKGSIYLNNEYIEGTTLPSAYMVNSAVSFLKQSHEDEKVFVAPYMSILYYLAGRSNPTMYDNLLKGYLFEPYGESYIINSLESNKVRFVIYDRENGPSNIGGNKLRDYYPRLDDYLMQNFIIERQVESWLLMKRI